MHPASLKQATPNGININVQQNTTPTMAQISATGRQNISLIASESTPPAMRKQKPTIIKVITSVKINIAVIISLPPYLFYLSKSIKTLPILQDMSKVPSALLFIFRSVANPVKL